MKAGSANIAGAIGLFGNDQAVIYLLPFAEQYPFLCPILLFDSAIVNLIRSERIK